MATSKSKKAKKSADKPKNTNKKAEVTVVEEVVTVAENAEPETTVIEEVKTEEVKMKGIGWESSFIKNRKEIQN